MSSPILLNAARAFAHVSFADGQLSPKEAERFRRVASAEPGLAGLAASVIDAAWQTAFHEVEGSASFGHVLIAIRAEVTSVSDKAMLMRIAQAAIVADDKLEPQENAAVLKLAEALGLDPDNY